MKNRYFVTLIVVFNDGTADKKGIYEAKGETDEKAKDAVRALYHKNLGMYEAEDNVDCVLCHAYDLKNNFYGTESWEPTTSSAE